MATGRNSHDAVNSASFEYMEATINNVIERLDNGNITRLRATYMVISAYMANLLRATYMVISAYTQSYYDAVFQRRSLYETRDGIPFVACEIVKSHEGCTTLNSA